MTGFRNNSNSLANKLISTNLSITRTQFSINKISYVLFENINLAVDLINLFLNFEMRKISIYI